jgi:hypothetical protein
MNTRLKLLGAVLRKDLQLYWLFGVLTAAINLLAYFNAIVEKNMVIGGIVVAASLMATSLLILLVFHEDSAVSAKRDWLTRPVPGLTMLAAKCAFVGLFVLLPGVLGLMLDGFYLGHPPVKVLVSSVSEGLGSTALLGVLCTIVLAALTSGIRQAIGAFLVCMVTLVLGYILLLPASVFLDDSKARTLEWLATFAALAVLWILYGRRHGRRAALVLVGVAVLAGGTWFFAAERNDASPSSQERIKKISQGDLDVATTEIERFYALNAAAKNALKEGNDEKAATLANELAQLASKYTNDWNYGNAIQDSNQVLGRIALSNGDVAEASRRLLASADSKGSPQMNSFGPNMQLAKALLEKGETAVVIEYFNRCGTFWTMGKRDLARWTSAVKSGKIPDFGANLNY